MGTLSKIARRTGAAVDRGRRQPALWRKPLPAGFGNAQLIGALAILLVIGLLLMVQAGEIGLPLPAAKPDKAGTKAGSKSDVKSAAKGAKSAKGKDSAATTPPPLFVMAPSAPGFTPPGQAYLDQRAAALRSSDWRIGRTQQAYAYMDEAAAAQIVAKLDDEHAYTVLSGLDERALGRILEAAPPEKSAQWTNLLLARDKLPVVPPPLKGAAAERGMYDELDELLGAAGYGPDGLPLKPGAPGSAPVSAATPPQPAASGTLPPIPPGTPGTTPAGGTPPAGTAPPLTSPSASTPAVPATGSPGTAQPGTAGGAGSAAPGAGGATSPPPTPPNP